MFFMNISVEKLPKSQMKLVIELDETSTAKFYEKAAKQISNIVKIPGFRPGHVPLDILKNHVPEEKIEAHMVDIALPESYAQAVTKEKIQAISRPQIKIVSVKPFKYEATVAVYPEVKISGYDSVKIPVEKVEVKEEEIDEFLKNLQKQHATFKDVEREAKMGDKVEVDFEGFDEGDAPLENTKSTNHPVVLGDKTLVDGFEEELVGLKKDQKKEFTVTFPKDYFHKKFQNKKVKFKVEVKRVQEIELPELSPEFIKKISGQEKSLVEIKENLRENMLHEKKHQEKVRRENLFLEKIIELTKVDVPESLIEEEIDGMVDEFKSELENRGMTYDQFLEANKKEEKDIRGQYRKEAEKRLILRFGLQKLFEQEKLDVSEKDLEQEIEHIIQLYPAKEHYKIRQDYKKGSYLYRRLENKLKMEKLFERFLGK